MKKKKSVSQKKSKLTRKQEIELDKYVTMSAGGFCLFIVLITLLLSLWINLSFFLGVASMWFLFSLVSFFCGYSRGMEVLKMSEENK